MDQIDEYRTLNELSEGVYRDRGSKFIGYAGPVYDLKGIKEFLKRTAKEHPKARHVCYAYRLGRDGNNFRENDDGEPSGSAGKPILGQIDSHRLSNIIIAVTRYFGGKLLGVPGLIKAYKSAAGSAITNGKILTKTVNDYFRINSGYGQLNELLNLVKNGTYIVANETYESTPELIVGVRKKLSSDFSKQLDLIDGINYKIEYTL